MARAYSLVTCWICGKQISSNGLAQYNHYMMHVRRGEMTVARHWDHYAGMGYNVYKVTDAGRRARERRLAGDA